MGRVGLAAGREKEVGKRSRWERGRGRRKRGKVRCKRGSQLVERDEKGKD